MAHALSHPSGWPALYCRPLIVRLEDDGVCWSEQSKILTLAECGYDLSHDVGIAVAQNDPLHLTKRCNGPVLGGAWIGLIAFALIYLRIPRKEHHVDCAQMMIKFLSTGFALPKNTSVFAIDQVDQPIQ